MNYFPAAFLIIAVSVAFPAAAQDLNLDASDLALSGYDPVEYLQFNRALKGFTDIETRFNGARYRFRNQENQERFLADPDRYLPAYGGWCAYSLAMDDPEYPRGKYPVDPKSFKIVDGRLHLFYNDAELDALQQWNHDEARYRAVADREWAAINR